jgi:hypothetical protein
MSFLLLEFGRAETGVSVVREVVAAAEETGREGVLGFLRVFGDAVSDGVKRER